MAVPRRLYGKSVLVGRDPLGNGRLRVRVDGKAADITMDSAVPSSVSRLKDNGDAHFRVDIDGSGSIRVTNLNPNNVTCLGGMQIVSKTVVEGDVLLLGKDGFRAEMSRILDAAGKLVPGVYSISHLEGVYKEYEEALESIQKKQQDRQRLRMLPIMFGSLNGLLAVILPAVGITNSLWVTLPLAVISFALYFVIIGRKDTSMEDRKAATERFTAAYVCPKCGRFMGNVSYRLLRQNNPGPEMTCPGPNCKAHLRFEE